MRKKVLREIPIRLDLYQFILAKKVLHIEKEAFSIAHRDDLFPFVKPFHKINIRPLYKITKYRPILYLDKTSVRMGFVTSIKKESVKVSIIKFFPSSDVVEKKKILGTIAFFYPFFIFKLLLKYRLSTRKYSQLK